MIVKKLNGDDMKKLTLASLIILTACSAPIDLNTLKTQIREELKKESPAPTATASPEPSAKPTSEPTPIPTATPFTFSTEAKSAISEAIDALLAMKSKSESGISYANYIKDVADLNVITDKAIRQTDFDKHPAAATIKRSIQHFLDAKDIWSCYYTENNLNNFLSGVCSTKYGPMLEETYFIQPVDSSEYKKYYLDKSIAVIWQRAGMQADYSYQRK